MKKIYFGCFQEDYKFSMSPPQMVVDFQETRNLLKIERLKFHSLPYVWKII